MSTRCNCVVYNGEDCSDVSGDVYCGRITAISEFELTVYSDVLALSSLNWRRRYYLLLVGQEQSIKNGRQVQMYFDMSMARIFKNATIDDWELLARLIGILEHRMPHESTNYLKSGARRTYFVKDFSRDHYICTNICFTDVINWGSQYAVGRRVC